MRQRKIPTANPQPFIANGAVVIHFIRPLSISCVQINPECSCSFDLTHIYTRLLMPAPKTPPKHICLNDRKTGDCWHQHFLFLQQMYTLKKMHWITTIACTAHTFTPSLLTVSLPRGNKSMEGGGNRQTTGRVEWGGGVISHTSHIHATLRFQSLHSRLDVLNSEVPSENIGSISQEA